MDQITRDMLDRIGEIVSETPRTKAALRVYGEALITGTTEDVLAADAEVDAAIKEELQ
jgi:hypothetical protein